MSKLKLFGANVCPFVHRSRLALAEKGLEYEYVAIDLRNKPDWYHDVLPSGKVPLLEHAGHRIWESAVVCEYLEDAFSTPSLLPRDPGARAAARLFIDWTSSTFVPVYYKLLKAQSETEQAEARVALTDALQKIEDQLAEGPWLLGAELTLADLELYPWFERWGVLEHYRDFSVPQSLVKLHAWIAALAERPGVAAIAEEPQFYIEQYKSYAEPALAK